MIVRPEEGPCRGQNPQESGREQGRACPWLDCLEWNFLIFKELPWGPAQLRVLQFEPLEGKVDILLFFECLVLSNVRYL